MKRPIPWWTPVLAVLLSLTSCGARVSASPLGLSGNGDVVVRELRVSGFDAVSFGGAGILRFHRAPAHRVVVTLDSNLQESFRAERRGSTLELGFRPGTRVHGFTKLEIDVYLPELTGLALSGSAEAALLDVFRGDEFKVAVSGAGRLIGEVRMDRIRVSLSGSGSVELGGEADRMDAEISGAGVIKASRLEVRSARAGLTGLGFLDIRVRDDLDISLSGAGRVRYFGDPKVKSSVSGAGTVERAGA